MLIFCDKIFYFNVVKFYGFMVVDNEKYLIGEYCWKGFLVEVL